MKLESYLSGEHHASHFTISYQIWNHSNITLLQVSEVHFPLVRHNMVKNVDLVVAYISIFRENSTAYDSIVSIL